MASIYGFLFPTLQHSLCSDPYSLEGRPDFSIPYILESDLNTWMLCLDQGWTSLCSITRSGTATIQPIRVTTCIIPNAEDEHHASAQRLPNARQPVTLLAIWCCRTAVRVVHDSCRQIACCDRGVANDMAILDVHSTNLNESSSGGPVVRDELRNDNEDAVRFNSVIARRAVKVRDVVDIRVPAATPFIANSFCLLTLVASTSARSSSMVRFLKKKKDKKKVSV